ncbi:MAG TPA: nuclear transport factor 2 family protein [Burkholderiaceae bacterium]
MTDALALIRNVYAAFGRGDVPALLALTAPDVDWQFHGDRDAGYTGTVRGPAQLGEWFGAVAQEDDIQAFEPREFLAGPDHVTVIGHERTIARATGRVFETPWIHVWRVRDGVVAGFTGFFDTQAAAEARAGAKSPAAATP